MGKIVNNLTELVGNTPLLQLSRYNAAENLSATIIAKLEYFNPAGSVKDRIALAMIEETRAAEARRHNNRTYKWQHRCGNSYGGCRQRL